MAEVAEARAPASADTGARAAQRTAAGSTRPRAARPPEWGKRLLYLWTGIVYAFLFLPIVMVLITSFNPTGLTRFPPEGFSLRWYEELLRDRDLQAAFSTSLSIALLSALATSVLGLSAAYGLTRSFVPGKRAFQAFFYLPILVPGIVAGISLLMYFSFVGLKTGYATIVLAHVTHAIPYTLTLILTSFYGFDRTLEEAAQDLGADPWRTFWRVTFPLVLPGVIGGALIAFTVSFDEFVITSFVAGSGVQTLPLVIYSRIRFMLSPVINAAAAVVLILSMTLILAGQLLVMRRR